MCDCICGWIRVQVRGCVKSVGMTAYTWYMYSGTIDTIGNQNFVRYSEVSVTQISFRYISVRR